MASDANAKPSWSLKMTAPLEPGIVCHDLDAMLEFYTGVLGLELVGDTETMPEMSKRFGATPHGYRIVRLQTPHGGLIKLVQPKREPPRPQAVPRWVYQRHGLAYLTFVITNMQDVVKRLKAHGVKLVSDELIEVRPGVLALYSLDPEGNYVEFVEYPDSSVSTSK